MKSAFLGLLVMLTTTAVAADKSVDLYTARGAPIKLDVYNPGASSTLILAPGQGCGPRLDMYDAIGVQAKRADYTLVRLYWAYCVADAEKGQPSEDLSFEKEDLMTAMAYAQSELKADDAKTFIGGKSLGTMVSTEIFSSLPGLGGLVLLTPLCTNRADPDKPENVFAGIYPKLAEEKRPVLVAQGNQDALCDTNHFQAYMKERTINFVPLVVSGDHGFRVMGADGKLDEAKTQKNLLAIASWVFSWLQ